MRHFSVTRTVAVLVGIGVVGSFTSLASGASAAGGSERKVSVSGECHRSVVPDRGAVNLVAEVKDSDVKSAAKKAQESYDRVRERVSRLKLEGAELRTSEYRVYELKEWDKGKSVSRGFVARMGLHVSTQAIQRLGEVIELAAREGLQDVSGLQTYLSDELREKERLACLKDAALHARAKAERLAEALGAKVGEVISLNESASVPQPVPMEGVAFRAMDRSEAPPAQVEPGKQTLAITIQASFQLK